MSTSSAPRKILVAAATGKQGSALVRSLAAANAALPAESPDKFEILALTRMASSASAQSLLQHRGVTLVEGNLKDPVSVLRKAGPDVYGVFAVTAPGGSVGFGGDEVTNGKALADASLAAGVKHYVATTAERGDTEGATGVPQFDSKIEIEDHIRSLSTLSSTILQPVYFMDNHTKFSSMYGKVFGTMLETIFSDPSKKQQMVACEDIGNIAGAIFQNPDKYAGQTIAIASDSMTIPELKATFRTVYGKDMPTTFGFFAPLLKMASNEMSTMYKFFDKTGFNADISALQAQFPEVKLTTWETYLERRKAAGDH